MHPQPTPHHGKPIALRRRGFLALATGAALVRGPRPLLAQPHVVRGWSGAADARSMGVMPGTDADMAPALNAAIEGMAKGGGTLRIAPGEYRLGGTVWLDSGLTLEGPSATLFADDRWQRNQQQIMVSRFALLANRRADATAITDRDIAVRGLGFAYRGFQHGDAHAIALRRVDGVQVIECRFRGGGNGTALLACRHTLVAGSFADGTRNCAFDHWEGTSDGEVRDCRATLDIGYGILFTGQGTARDNHQTAARLTARANVIEGSGVGIWVCSLSEHSAVTDVVLDRNTVRGGARTTNGIGATGAIHRIAITANRISGVQGGNPLFSRADVWNRPTDVVISGNTVQDSTPSARGIALIQALGDGVTVRGNRASGGSYRSLVWVDGTGVELADNHGDGLTSRFKYNAAAARAPRIADP